MADEAQVEVLRDWMAERVDGTWSAFECADFEPRQGGKGAKLEVRQLGGLFLWDEELQVHTAHQFKTANEHFLRLAGRVKRSRALMSRVARIRYANGEQGIELKNGCRIKFLARSGGSGRGFAGVSTVYFDEAMYLSASEIGAALPTMSTHPNPQVIYTGSGGFASSSLQWALRRRALSGDGGRLAYHEWTAEDVELVEDGRVATNRADLDPADRSLWARANPALGRRISEEFVDSEFRSLPAEEFLRERLCVWEPEPVERAESVLSVAALKGCHEPGRPVAGPVGFAVDVSPDGKRCAVAAACRFGEGFHVELGPATNTADVAALLVRLSAAVESVGVGIDTGSAAKALVPSLEDAGLAVVKLSAGDHAAACGALLTDVEAGRFSWRAAVDELPLLNAVRGAGIRPLGDRWAWDRRLPETDITPLVAVTLARWVAATGEAPPAKRKFAY